MKGEKRFLCTNCGYEATKWLGRCPVCGEWGSLKEVRGVERKEGERKLVRPVPLKDVTVKDRERVTTGIREFDRVLGGGVPRGAFIVLGGEPGIGKSTLALQVALSLQERGLKVLYVTAEESLGQLRERCERISEKGINLLVMEGEEIESVAQVVEELKPSLLVLDSIQTVRVSDLPSPEGSITQVRGCGTRLLRLTKELGITVIAISHVTKDGTLAGPKTLEHMVDVVLSIEGERTSDLRILRALKNRYGSTEELGIFEMTARGLMEVENPSLYFISKERIAREGTTIVPLLEGKRPILVEIQSLVSPTYYSVPQRSSTGYDIRRLHMILALLEKRLKISLSRYDVFVNVTGGIKIQESAADLGVAGERSQSLPMWSLWEKLV
jgi:DNA repair protein RadA/Sms